MATINRFNRFLPRDYSMEHYVPKLVMPNFEMWDQTLGAQQNKIDSAKLMFSDKMPKYLQTEEDRNLLQQYKQFTNEALADISKTYQSQGVQAGNQKLRDLGQQLLREWQPGGKAAVLEDRYNAYQNALKEIEESYKKDPRGVNKQFAVNQLQESLKKPISYNPETGEYERINTPELYQDPNIQKLILDAIKEVEDSGDTQIVRLSPTMLQKIKTEGRNPDVLASVAQAVYEQFPQQLNIETWYRNKSTDPVVLKQNYEKQLNGLVANQEQLISNKSKLTKPQIVQLQEELVKNGFNIKVDGVFGQETEKALTENIEKTKGLVKEKVNNFDPLEYNREQVIRSYDAFARSFANKKIDKDIVWDKAALQQMKINADRANTNKLITAMQSIANPETTNIGTTPDQGFRFEDWEKQTAKAGQNLKQAENLFYQLTNGVTGQMLGKDPTKMSGLINAYSQSGGNKEKFKELIAKQGINAGVDLDKAFDHITDNYEGINQVLGTYTNARNNYDMLNQNDLSITKIWAENEGKEKYQELRNKYKKPGETEEDFMKALNAGGSRFDIYAENKGSRLYGHKIGNDAALFLGQRSRDVSKSKDKSKYAKSMNSYEIVVPDSKFAQGLLFDVNNGDYYGYVDEGMQGFTWRNKKGDEVKGNVKGQQVTVVTAGTNGKTQLKFTGFVKNEEGKEIPVETYTDVPETRKQSTINHLMAVRATAKRMNDRPTIESVDLALANLRGNLNYTKLASQDVMPVTSDNATTNQVKYPIVDNNGSITGVRDAYLKGVKVETSELAGRSYNKYKVRDDNGQYYYRLTMNTPQGEVVVYNNNGGMNFSSSSAVDLFLEGKKNDLEIPVDLKIDRVPDGQQISPQMLGLMFNNQ